MTREQKIKLIEAYVYLPRGFEVNKFLGSAKEYLGNPNKHLVLVELYWKVANENKFSMTRAIKNEIK